MDCEGNMKNFRHGMFMPHSPFVLNYYARLNVLLCLGFILWSDLKQFCL